MILAGRLLKLSMLKLNESDGINERMVRGDDTNMVEDKDPINGKMARVSRDRLSSLGGNS